MAEGLPLLQKNVATNVAALLEPASPRFIGHGHGLVPQAIQVAELVWGRAADLTTVGLPFDLVLCSEVIYDAGVLADLWSTLENLIAPGGEVLMTYKLRGLAETEFIDTARRRPDVVLINVPRSLLPADLRADLDLQAIRLRFTTEG